MEIHYDINDLNFNYKQCKICNCIYHKDDFKNVSHCDECDICVEGCEQHCNFVTKCIGRKNKNIFKGLNCFFCFSYFYNVFVFNI